MPPSAASSASTLTARDAIPNFPDAADPLRIAMVAGERSGDLLGTRVIRALRTSQGHRELHIEGIGGEGMIAEGLECVYPMERLSVMGLVEPLGRLPELLALRRRLARQWLANPPDLFLGIDAPDFNLGLAHRLRRGGLRTAQLVSPTVWAWRPRRVHTVARAVDSLLCLFPFEPPLYEGLPVAAHYVGHPLVKEFSDVPDRAAARRDLRIDDAATVIALLPGSRASEVKQLGAVMLEAGRLLQSRDPHRVLLMPAAGPDRLQQLRELLRHSAMETQVRLVEGQSREVMIAADALCLASGTASFEAMLLERPMVIAYRVAQASWSLMSRLAVTPFVGLPNILAGRAVVPELLQDALSAPALALALEEQLQCGDQQVSSLKEPRESLSRDFDEAVSLALKSTLEMKHGG